MKSLVLATLVFCTGCGFQNAGTKLAVHMRPSGAQVTTARALYVVDHCWNKAMAHQGFHVDLKPESFRIVTDYYRCTYNGCGMGVFNGDFGHETVGPGSLEIAWNRVEEILPLKVGGRTYVNLRFTVNANEVTYLYPQTSSYTEVWTLTCDGTAFTANELVDALALLTGPEKLW